MKKRKYLSSFIIFIAAGIMAGTVLLVFVYLLPVTQMKEHVFESVSIFEEEGRLPQLIPGDKYTFTCLDNYTDAIMLNSAIFEGEGSAVEQAMKIYRKEYEETADTCESLIAYANGTEGYYIEPYARYWHGYLIYLKPLLLFLNYGQIRIFNLAVQLLMAVGIMIGMLRQKLHCYVLPFAVSALLLIPAAIPLSLQYASLGYVILISILVLLWQFSNLEEKGRTGFLFCAVGMASSYVDLLTYPPVTLGFLLVLYLALRKEEWVDQLRTSIVCMILWGMGYAGMWAGKWLVGSILLKENIIADAANSIGIRTSNHDFAVDFTYGEVLYKNFAFLNSAVGKSLLGIMVFGLIITVFYQCKRSYGKMDLRRIIPYLFIGSIPFVWYYVLSNHVFIHARFTFRIAVITILALQCGFVSLRKKKEME